MARRPFNELCPSTVSNYRSKLRQIWLKTTTGTASESDLLEIAELERLLRVKASEVRGPGRPPKYRNRTA